MVELAHVGRAGQVRRLITIVAMLALLVTTVGSAAAADAQQAAAQAQPKAGCTFFAVTGHNLCAGFQRYWQTYGGLAVFGYPLTEEFVDPTTHLTTQYFERAVFEWHPGAWPARWDVELRLIGDIYAQQNDLRSTGPFTGTNSCPSGGAVFQGATATLQGTGPCLSFPATGHTLRGAFLDYWQSHGGLAIFGYPISEAFNYNGMQVQYLERARFEWHSEFMGTTNEIELGLLGDRLLMGAGITTVAAGLANPRQLGAAYDTASAAELLLVADAGLGGSNCIGSGASRACLGATGNITEVLNGGVSPVVSGLGSEATAQGVSGPSSVAPAPLGVLYYVIQGPGGPQDRQALGSAGAPFGKLYKYDELSGQTTMVADLAAFEYANNPDKNNPLPPGENPLDSDPYSVFDAGSYRLVVDAAGNDLLKVDANGTISVVAVFPVIMMDSPPALKLPPGTQIPAQAVPTSVVVGPDGNYYVSELSGFPFEPGKANIMKVTPQGQVSVYASGLTNVMDLAFDSLGHLFAVELVQTGLLSAGSPPDYQAHQGAVVRINPDGSHTVLATVPAPGGIAVGPDDSLFVTINTDSATSNGQVVKIDY